MHSDSVSFDFAALEFRPLAIYKQVSKTLAYHQSLGRLLEPLILQMVNDKMSQLLHDHVPIV